MTHHERYDRRFCPCCGERIDSNSDPEKIYSRWHRTSSLERFVGFENAYRCAMINIDQTLWVECQDNGFQPIALIETAQDIGQKRKPATMLKNMAVRAVLPAFIVLYTLDDNTIDPVTLDRKIVRFCTKPIHIIERDTYNVLTPEEFARGLVSLRKVGTEILTEDLRKGNQLKRNHDVERWLEKINRVKKQSEFPW